MATAAMFRRIVKCLDEADIDNTTIVTFKELGSEGGKLEVALPNGSLGIREERQVWVITRDGSSTYTGVRRI